MGPGERSATDLTKPLPRIFTRTSPYWDVTRGGLTLKTSPPKMNEGLTMHTFESSNAFKTASSVIFFPAKYPAMTGAESAPPRASGTMDATET